jgi:hypothetical protein
METRAKCRDISLAKLKPENKVTYELGSSSEIVVLFLGGMQSHDNDQGGRSGWWGEHTCSAKAAVFRGTPCATSFASLS